MKAEDRSGYLHAAYAESLCHLGRPRFLSRAGAWVLERAVPTTPHHDAVSCYPFLVCGDWRRLPEDLASLSSDLVSFSAVTDPFADFDAQRLEQVFPDLFVPYKQHFVVDLCSDLKIDAHHRRNVRRALRHVNVERCPDTANFGDDWVRLYANLATRHKMSAFSNFPESSLLDLLAVPGIVVYRAECLGHTVGAVLCFIQGEVAYYHLGAYSDEGYRLGAAFALFDQMLRSLRGDGLRWLSLGAGAGTDAAMTDGLTRFKKGWANETRTVYLCGRIYNRLAYDELVKARGIARGNYFPLYRQGETVSTSERE